MKVKKYDQFNESVYQAKLANGLTVTMLPKTGYHKTYATLTTNYGSIDNTFVPAGSTELQRFPDGIAHFLEHKMFEKADHDAFQIFGQYGPVPTPLPVSLKPAICFRRRVISRKI
ncbi:zinc-dependent proteinase [Lactiplantibacillus plantarum]|nr:zinc-dependent proteinase [Lactiplantibacillus plantarum]